MNELVYKYGSEAKAAGVEVREYVNTYGSSAEKIKSLGLGKFEPIAPGDNSICNDSNVKIINDIYTNGICAGTSTLKTNCKEILDLGLSTGNGFYELKNGKSVYCDMSEGGWTLVTLINKNYGSQYLKSSLNENLPHSNEKPLDLSMGM